MSEFKVTFRIDFAAWHWRITTVVEAQNWRKPLWKSCGRHKLRRKAELVNAGADCICHIFNHPQLFQIREHRYRAWRSPLAEGVAEKKAKATKKTTATISCDIP